MKEHLRNKLFMIAAVLLVALPMLAPGQLGFFGTEQSTNETSYTVKYTVEFPQTDLSVTSQFGYECVQLRDAESLFDIGKPMVPVKEIMIALPSGCKVTDISVVDIQTVELPGQYMLLPGQPPLPTNQKENRQGFVGPDPVVYASNQPYPSRVVSFVRQCDLAGQSMAVVDLYPLQYIPVEKKLMMHTSLTLNIKGTGGYVCSDYLSPHSSAYAKQTYLDTVKAMVVNPEDVTLVEAPQSSSLILADLPSGGPYSHVIITDAEPYGSSFQPLVDWHTRIGLKDIVVDKDWIYANYTGSDNQQKIRNFIIAAYNSWGTPYFLLAGEHSIVPFKYITYYNDENTPSDQYYSDFDDDWTHEVYIGRASIDSSSEVTTFVNKVLKYEQNPPLTDYPLKALLIGMDLDSSTPAEQLKEYIDTYYIPSRFSLTKVYDSQGTNHKTAALNALNSGQNLVNHADHCNDQVMGVGYIHHNWNIGLSDVNGLTNDNKMSIIVSTGCWPNAMDSSDCISEYFVNRNPLQAGVAFTGNTRDGWYSQGDVYSLSNLLDQMWWRGVFIQNMYTLGQALVYTKHQFWDGNDINKHCEWTFNLLGEPAMPIWTNTPGNVKVTYPSPIPVGTSTFLVHVEDAVTHVPVSQALVCLRKESEVYLTGVTNSNGDVILYPSPSTNGNMYVDVTAHNYLLNETIAVVSAGPGAPYLPSNPSPALGATTVDVMTNLAWTSGDPNGDTVTYDVYFGLSFPLPLVASDFPSTTYDPPGDLSYGKTYYWKIVADDNNGSITYGPTWSFTTLSERYMRIDHAQGISGSQLTMYLTGKWNLTIGGYDMAMYYDASKITITKIDLVGTVADYPDTEWQVYPVYGTGKAAAAAIAMDYNPPDDILPPGLGTLFRITVTIKDGAVNGDTILNLDENVIIGSVPYYCTYAPPEGPVVFPELVDGVLTISDYICGDVNNDGVVNVGDVVYLINYLYKGGDPPVPMPCVGDVNNDSVVNVGDVVYLINYLYRGGSAPGTCCQ